MRRVSPSPLFSNPIQCRSIVSEPRNYGEKGRKDGRNTERGEKVGNRLTWSALLPPAILLPRRAAAAINTRKPLRLQGCFLNAGESPQVSWNLRQREVTDETFGKSRVIRGLFFCGPRNRRRIKGRARTGPGHRGPLRLCSVREGKNGGRRQSGREREPAAAAASVKQRPEQSTPLLTSLLFRKSERL